MVVAREREVGTKEGVEVQEEVVAEVRVALEQGAEDEGAVSVEAAVVEAATVDIGGDDMVVEGVAAEAAGMWGR